MAGVLIIDDDEKVCEFLLRLVERLGHEGAVSCTLREGMEKARAGRFDVVFLDVMMSDGNGIDLLPKLRSLPSAPEVIIMTSRGDPDGAELAIRNGAWDYIEKPSPLQEIELPLLRALQYREERGGGGRPVALKRGGIVGESPRLRACLDLLAEAAASDANVLITGETGTGKELFARAIHENSSRAEASFVVVDCTILPETLVESLLFGHEKGSFTGADRSRTGLIRQADGGTLFLDEVGELPLSVQKAFLRVLEERRFRPLGAKQEIRSDFRLVAATNRDLDAMVRKGVFRSDLLFRLRSLSIELPPLRERPEDIKELALHYADRLCVRYEIERKGFSADFFEALSAYDWPGNVRELIHVMEQALVAARHESTLFSNHLPVRIRVRAARSALGSKTSLPVPVDPGAGETVRSLPSLRDFREAAVAEAERNYLERLLIACKGDLKAARRISGLSRPRLYALLKKHHLTPTRGERLLLSEGAGCPVH